MKKIFILSFVFISSAFANQIDDFKWHLNPHGQNVLVEVNDLHTEYIQASPELDFGHKGLEKIKLKSKVKVAIIDSGIDYEHPDLSDALAYKKDECYKDNIIPAMESDSDQNNKKNDCLGWNFAEETNNVEDTDGHGTHVAGIINDLFKKHQAHLEILPLKIFSDSKEDKPLPIKVGAALEYAIAEKVDLIHLSMGWPESLMSIKIQKIIEKALSQGIYIIAASGNSVQRANIYPCKINGVICVGALRANGKLASFSNYGPQVDFLAPGERILSTIPMSLNPVGLPIKGYDYKSGTSQAAPIISGAILFLKSVFPKLLNEEILNKVEQVAALSDKSVKGFFNILEAIKTEVKPIIKPELKNLNTYNISKAEKLSLKFNNNYKSNLKSHLEITCDELSIYSESLSVKSNGTVEVSIELPKLKSDELELECKLRLNDQEYSFSLRLLDELNSNTKEYVLKDSKIILPTRKGVRSRLISIPLMRGYKRYPYYYLAGDENFTFYYLNQQVGVVEVGDKCKKLRVLQYDFNADGANDILFEEVCDGKFLKYHFYDNQLNKIYESVKFTPKLSVINYNGFYFNEINGKPSFRYINNGYSLVSSDP